MVSSLRSKHTCAHTYLLDTNVHKRKNADSDHAVDCIFQQIFSVGAIVGSLPPVVGYLIEVYLQYYAIKVSVNRAESTDIKLEG